jgi:hypothetical protein
MIPFNAAVHAASRIVGNVSNLARAATLRRLRALRSAMGANGANLAWSDVTAIVPDGGPSMKAYPCRGALISAMAGIALLIGFCIPVPLTAQEDGAVLKGPQIKQENGISFVSGGVGREEVDALNHSRDFNLKLTMAAPNGEFVVPSVLRIDDGHGATVLQTRPDGPVFLAKLPAGDYVVHATAEGQSQSRKVSVPASGQQAVEFTWRSSPQEPSVPEGVGRSSAPSTLE